MTPFLITGCGRSGTGWAAALFTRCGIACTHEGQFNLSTSGPLSGGESSWLAIPHLDSLDPSTRLLHIVRDPYDVVRSALKRGFLHGVGRKDTPYENYVAAHRPDITGAPDALGRAIRWATLWDAPLDQPGSHEILRTGGPVHLTTFALHYVMGRYIGHDTVRRHMADLGQRVNTNPPNSFTAPTREEIDAHPDGALVRSRAHRYGFMHTRETPEGDWP